MLRKKKLYSKPRKKYDLVRIKQEAELIKKFGLKNKKEIWKAEAVIERIRSQAKKLITASQEEQKSLFERLKKMGFKIEKIADVLSLEKQDWLKRRLQTVVFEKKLASTPKQARQLITHKHVKVRNNIINIPSYIVKTDEDDLIQIIKKKKTGKQEKEKIKEQEKENQNQEQDKSGEEK